MRLSFQSIRFNHYKQPPPPPTTTVQMSAFSSSAAGNGLLKRRPVKGRDRKVVIIMGATGSGKSRLSIELANYFPSEIINSDKIQVYRGLDISTNKIPMEDRVRVPHHLLGEIDSAKHGELMWIDVSLPVLNEYIGKRVDDMIDSGMVDESEVDELPPNTGIRKTICVPEFERYFRYGCDACGKERDQGTQEKDGGVRPFGVSLLIAGFDESGPQLYEVDPSGSYFSWKASAMGKNVSNAKTFLGKSFEGQISGKNIEIGIIGSDKKFRVLTPAEIDDYLGEVE